MATMLGSLLISLGLDSGQFRSGMSTAEKDLVKFQRQAQRTASAMKDLGARMTIGITAPLAAFGGFAVNAASDAAELQSAFDQTFGSMSKAMTQWAEETGNAMGRSTQEIQKATNTFGIFFNQAAPTRQAAADLSKEFAILAQDLSSFYNTDPGEALAKLRSGLAGESEPLRDFGVFLTEANVKAKALEMGLAGSADAITEQNKVMARAALIMEATTNAQGDVMRTADGTANRVRAAKAAFEELQVAIGEKLIPAITPLISTLTAVLDSFSKLPEGVQTSLVVLAGLAAATGPLVFLVGSLKSALVTLSGVFVATSTTAAGTTAAVGGLRGAILALQTSLGPVLVTLGLVAGAYALLTARSADARQKTEEFEQSAEEAEKTAARYKQKLDQAGVAVEGMGKYAEGATGEINGMAQSMRDAIGAAEDLIATLKQLGITRLAARNVELEQDKKKIKAEVARQRTVPVAYTPGGGMGAAYSAANVKADIRTEEQKRSLTAIEKEIAANNDQMMLILKGYNAGVDVTGDGAPSSTTSPSGTKGDGRKSRAGRAGQPTGITRAELERRFVSEAARLDAEELEARRQAATDATERADIAGELLSLEVKERRRQLEEEFAAAAAEVAESERMSAAEKQQSLDYLAQQKAAQAAVIDELYGVATDIAENGDILVTAKEGLYEDALRREYAIDLEREALALAEAEFDTKRDLLQLDYELADTQGERKAIAAEILALEQEYRRNQLELVVASAEASETEKKRAAALLASLDAIEARERAAGEKANRTELERYLDDLDMSAAEINEAIDGIKIDGLEALNDGIVDAIMGVKSLGEVFANVAKQIIADLLRIAVQKAIIEPLAKSLFSSESGWGGPFPILDGARAMGGPVLAGGTYLVGENGPEIFHPGSSGTIIPNHELGRGGGSMIQVVPSPYFDVVVDGRVQQAAPAIMQGGSMVAQRSMARRQSRRVG
ncbi:hypothetical protein E3U23_11175 [Erythrobacter litoralis]|uniref:hypothetical protein n=1 Tax=Erythrobacter litoralis TaxID=39960 RepID=UPI0024352F1E|nr:hypothetical protein [Erythrobacter litoralis]MDG6079750.1 hypothetical protein [Erythrobacter litoralis]